MPSPRYDYANPLCCLAPGNGNGALICDLTIDAMRTAGCNMHFIMVDIGTNAQTRGYTNGATPKDKDALALERILLQAPCISRNGVAWQPPHVCAETDIALPYPQHALPSGLPISPYTKAMALFTPQHAMFCLQHPQHLRFYGAECADPSGFMLAAAMAAEYVGQISSGQALQHAVLHVLYSGKLPYGLYLPGKGRVAIDGVDFCREVRERLIVSPSPHPSAIDWNAVFKQNSLISRLRIRHMSALK